jgi:hypothetical protein
MESFAFVLVMVGAGLFIGHRVKERRRAQVQNLATRLGLTFERYFLGQVDSVD